jgi:2-polyprenyl-3-methyl-5-hydroxy-6-metoxy-1,4-benzoquinol methylase
MSEPQCPSCGSAALRDRGKIPDAHRFAGIRLNHALPGGHLYHCIGCHLHFRHPRLGQEEMDHWYRQAQPEEWSAPLSLRTDCGIATRWIHGAMSAGKVLDIGCFRGDFLISLGPSYDSYGIEINGAAADIARSREIKVIGRDFGDLAGHEGKFDVITAIDVIEHVPDPLAMLRTMGQALRPGGVGIVSTGNTSAWSWRMMGSRYWYCAFAEHIAFINPPWCRRAADKLGLTVEEIEMFAYAGQPAVKTFSDVVKNLVYRCSPGLVAWTRRHWKAKAGNVVVSGPDDHPPSWTTACDHLIVQFRKPSAEVSG